MKPFIKEILSDTALLSVLIIFPLAFLGPGWRTNHSAVPQHGSFRDKHQPVSGETPEKEHERHKRDISLLRAFEIEEDARDEQESNGGT